MLGGQAVVWSYYVTVLTAMRDGDGGRLRMLYEAARCVSLCICGPGASIASLIKQSCIQSEKLKDLAALQDSRAA